MWDCKGGQMMAAFQETKDLLWQQLGQSKEMVMATSYQDQVTARTMSLVVYEEKLYFISSGNTAKIAQLKNNPRTALCLDGIRLLGQVSLHGHPSDAANQAVAAAHQAAFPFWFNRFKDMPEAILAEITPESCSFAIHQEAGPPKFYALDFIAGTGGEIKH